MLGTISCLDNQKSTRRFKIGVKPSAAGVFPASQKGGFENGKS